MREQEHEMLAVLAEKEHNILDKTREQQQEIDELQRKIE